MPKKTVREMTDLERKHYSLSARVFHAVIMGSAILGLVAFCIGMGLYTLALVHRNIDEAFNLTRSAGSILTKVSYIDPLIEEVLDVWDTMSQEERQETGSEAYRERFSSVQERSDWQTVLSVLNDFRESSDVNDIYLAMYERENSALVYLADPDPSEYHFDPGEWEVVESKEIEKFLTWDGDGKLYDISDTEKYGWMCTAGVPVRNAEGETIAFVLADVTLSEMAGQMKAFLYQYIVAMSITTLLLGLLFTWHMKKTLVNPINSIAEAAQAYVQAKHDGAETTEFFSNLNIRTGDEVENLSFVMADMERDLADYIENLTEVTAEKERISTELDLARRIQKHMLPNIFPPFPERNDFDIYATMNPAKEVGGDFYDYFLLDKDHVALVIADVSGKGIPAAMFMMRAKAAIGNAARTGISTDKILTEVNNFLCEGNEAEMFVTVWIGIIDLTTGVMQCSNAGHEYPVLYRAGEKYELLKDRHSLVLAAMEDAPMSSYEIRFNKGDRLFVYTDGATEAINKNCEAYGTRRIVTKLNTLRHVSEEQALHALHHDIDMFVGGTEQFDDITLMGFTYLGTPSENFQSTDISDNFNDS